jgi:hypothetical protein
MKLLNLLLAIGVTTTSLCFAQISRTVMVQSNNSELLYPQNFFAANAGIARIGLGLAAHATSPTVQLTNGGTGATNAASARTNLGLGWSALTNSNAATALLGFGTNGQIVYGSTNTLTFTNNVNFASGDVQFSGTQIVGNGLYIDFDDGAVGGGVITLDTNSGIGFQGAAAATTRTNVGLGATWLTNTNAANFRTAIGLGTTNYVVFGSASIGGGPFINGSGVFYTTPTNGGLNLEEGILSDSTNGVVFTWDGVSTIIHAPLSFYTTNSAAVSRTNLGMPLQALTNTSNVTAMRALSGSTNTNHPYSGSISVTGTNNTNTLVFSNGILQSVQ